MPPKIILTFSPLAVLTQSTKVSTSKPGTMIGQNKQSGANAGGNGSAKPRRRRLLGAALLSPAAWAEIADSLKLSPRELQMVHGIFDNRTEAAVAAGLHMSGNTVHTHLKRLFRKLAVTTRTELVLCVMQELFALTVGDSGTLPPLCRNWANGRCPSRLPNRRL